MMKILFTRGSSIFSHYIRKGTGEPVSHVAFSFDDKFVIHSNLLGVHLQWHKSFLSSCQVVAYAQYDFCLPDEEEIFQGILDAYDGSAYDFGALLYFSKRMLEYRLFDRPLPPKNKWGSDRAFLCTGVFGKIPDRLRKQIILEDFPDYDIVTPWTIFKAIEKTGYANIYRIAVS